MDRRAFMLGAAALLASSPETAAQAARKFVVAPEFEPQVVNVNFAEMGGTIVVDVPNRFLYLIEGLGVARRYGVGVGRAGASFRGTAVIERKAKWPHWRPTDNMIKRNPKKYARYAGGMKGGPGNPLGARALYLYRDGRDTMYRIHGTTEPWSIGRAVSNGCIRMINEHVEDLYDRVSLGAQVVVLQ